MDTPVKGKDSYSLSLVNNFLYRAALGTIWLPASVANLTGRYAFCFLFACGRSACPVISLSSLNQTLVYHFLCIVLIWFVPRSFVYVHSLCTYT